MTHLNGGKPKAKDAEKEVPDSEDEDSEGSDEDEVAEGGELKTFTDNSDDCKLVLVVRTDLGMGKGALSLPHPPTIPPPSIPHLTTKQAKSQPKPPTQL